MKQLIIATNNLNKVAEFKSLLADQFNVLSLKDIGFNDDIAETGTTFFENAQIKSVTIATKYQISCVADDSGLEVKFLNNEPGVYSARYAGEPANDANNNAKLLANLEGATDRSARFVTVLCYVEDGKSYYFEGELQGTITHKAAGENGFGYDPIFIPNGYDITLAQMTLAQKNSISHRAMAIRKFVDFLVSK